MRIVQYKTMLDEDRKNILVRESSRNYPDLRNLNNPERLYLLANSVFDANHLAEEYVWLIAVNAKHHPIGVFEVSHGSDYASIVTPRELFVRLFLCGAHAFFLIHNHPSGDPKPSVLDIEITRRLRLLLNEVGIDMQEHIIVCSSACYAIVRGYSRSTEHFGSTSDTAQKTCTEKEHVRITVSNSGA